MGRYLCLAKGKFDEALPHLEKGDAGNLAELVRLEVEKPTDQQKRMALARGWWDVAAEEKNPVSRWALLRSGSWYEKLVPNLSGLERSEAQKRLTQVQQVANAAGMIRWSEALDTLIVGSWKVTWKYVLPSRSTSIEYLAFDAAQTFRRSGSTLGNWLVEGKEVVARHGTYTDRFRMVNPNQFMAVRLRSGQPYMQGIGVRYER